MTKETVGEIGSVFEYDNLLAGPGMPEAKAFLQQFSRTLVEMCAKFYDTIKDLPIEGEAQMQSVILPAMYQVANAVYAEQRVNRRQHKNQPSSGRLDYWVYYEEFVFLIELKFCWVTNYQSPVSLRILDAWAETLAQLDAVTKWESRDLAMRDNKVLKIAMLMAPGYQWASNKSGLKLPTEEEVAKGHKKLLKDLSPRVNWSYMWLLSDRLRWYQLDDGAGHELFPYLGIMTRVMNI